MALTRLGLNQSINLATNITGTLATGNGGTGATSFSPGKISQVLSQTTSSGLTYNSTSFVATPTKKAITPSATSSKILVHVDSANCYEDYSVNSYSFVTMYRNVSGSGTDLGNGTKGFTGFYEQNIAYGDIGWNCSFNFLDSPNTTNEVEYEVFVRSSSTSASYRWNFEGQSTITLMEVLA